MRVDDMIECIGKVERYIAGIDFESFSADERTVDAVIRNVEIIGEAARYVPAEIQERYPQVPWRSMRGSRNRLVHDYPGVDRAVL